MCTVSANTVSIACKRSGNCQHDRLADVIAQIPGRKRRGDDEDDAPLPLPSQLDPRLQRAARLTALDPDDGIPL